VKKNILRSYVTGIKDQSHGEGFSKILRYFFPEFVTAIILYSLPLLIDARWIAHLQSTSAFATLGITNTILHSITKIAEGLSVGTIVMTGQLNGMGSTKQVGRALTNAFWTTIIVGALVSCVLYFGAYRLYAWYRLPEAMVVLGAPFLRVRAIGVFFTFVYFALIGFMRGIKDTRTPMMIFIAGCVLFLFFDYALIFGAFGFPAWGLMGSAVASVIQSIVMCLIALFYVLKNSTLRTYQIQLFSAFTSTKSVWELCKLSLPVVIDKAALSWSYVWLGYCLAPMGTCVLASFAVVKDLERFALLPAIAFAQVITFLVSNDYGRHDWDGIKTNSKKIIFMASISVLGILYLCSLWPVEIIRMFDFKGEFTVFAAKMFPVVSILAFFDVLQLILAGALRGAANVQVVMWTRLLVCAGFFAPLAYMFSRITTPHILIKCVLVYSCLYIGNAVMGLVYIRRFRAEAWKTKSIEVEA